MRVKKLKYSKTNPYAFTEHRVIMAASILNSSSAIKASLMIVREFVKLRKMVDSNNDLRDRIHPNPFAKGGAFDLLSLLDKGGSWRVDPLIS